MSNTSYKTEFWNMMRRGQNLSGQYREMTDTTTGTYLLPEGADNLYNEALNKENFFRRLATVIQTLPLTALFTQFLLMRLQTGYHKAVLFRKTMTPSANMILKHTSWLLLQNSMFTSLRTNSSI
jgi:hypothetical protein